jgi:hypothetical protein
VIPHADFPEEDRPALADAIHDDGVLGCDEVLVHRRVDRALFALNPESLLDGDRHGVERPEEPAVAGPQMACGE